MRYKINKKYWSLEDRAAELAYDEQQSKYYRVDELDGLLSSLFMLCNAAMDIPQMEGVWGHPLLVCSVGSNRTLMVRKGTDQRVYPRYRRLYSFTVAPDECNGLKKPTAFYYSSEPISHRRFYRDRLLGRLSDEDWRRFLALVAIS